ncbi:hypothetical protein Tco_0136777 [Tanacetum coccineum]
MATFGSSMETSDRALNKLMELSGETEIPKRRLSKLHVMIREMEALEDRLVVFDSLQCLRETQQRENNKLAALTEMMVQTNDGIHEKEGHVDIMDLSD